MQEWIPLDTDWTIDDLPDVDSFNNIEKDLIHLKERPCDDFDLMGRTGVNWFTSSATVTMFYVVKKIPPRSSLYLREVSKCFPMPDGHKRYVLLQLNTNVSYPSNSNLVWYTAPDKNPLVRWISNKNPNKHIELYHYDGLGLKLMSNPLYVNAYIRFIGQMLTPSTGKFSPEDTLYMRFHIGYDDI